MTTPKPYQQKVEDAALAYATRNHSVSYADTADACAFSEGANWVLKNPPPEMQKQHFRIGDMGNDIKFYEVGTPEYEKIKLELEDIKKKQITDLSTKELLQNEKVRELVEACKGSMGSNQVKITTILKDWENL